MSSIQLLIPSETATFQLTWAFQLKKSGYPFLFMVYDVVILVIYHRKCLFCDKTQNSEINSMLTYYNSNRIY